MWRLEKDLLLRQAPHPISLGKELVRRGMHSLTGEDYQYLHKSDIPSYHFQKSLRRLPIPKVEDSVKRYLSAAKVVLPDAIYAETEKAIKQFEKTEAAALQKALLDYDKSHSDTSYISEPWFDMYLSARVPVPVNFNPFMMYAPDPEERFNHQLTRATNFAISYARFKRALDANCLAPEVYHLNPKKSDTKFFRSVCRALPPSLSWFGAVAFKAFPLDMSQYRSLFNGNRIPQKGKDVLFNDHSIRHCLVIHKGRMFRVNIFNETGEILPAESIHSSLAHILKNGAELAASSEAVGSLTTLDRDSWAAARVELEDAGNHESLRALDGALFALCLDDLKTEDHQRLVQSLLIGDDARNRWFDKCFQLIVDANGRSTINFEHSWGDGVAVLRLMEESFKDTNKHHFVSPEDIPSAVDEANVQEIEFKLTDSLKKKIAEAQTTHQDAHKDLQFATLEYKGMTRDTIKKTKLSPDSIMQLAIQMAYYELYKEFAPTYESCSTAAFLKGRTECIRSATAATSAAALAILEGKKDVRPLLEAVTTAHGQLVKDASMGQGFDRHLLGLKISAQRAGQPIPSFYEDAGYKRMGHFILSTSTLSTETIVFGGFGPVVPDGFGIGYNVVKNMLGAVISSNKSKRDAEEFSRAMYRSLDLLKAVFESEQNK